MVWWLLTLYPAIGLVLTPWVYKGESKRDRLGSLGNRAAMIVCMSLMWPILVFAVPSEWRDSDAYWEDREASDLERLLESVRQERLAPDPRLAEFDILLGIEPERKKLVWEDYLNQGWDVIDDSRLCDAPEFRVRDIVLPLEYRGVDIQSKVG